jgi:ribosome-binding protein aMBF1 (putative translation factor)
MSKRKRQKTTDAVKILEKAFVGKDERRKKKLEGVREALDIAGQIYKLRTEAGLTQKELADRVNTSQSDISRLESADYNGHTLKMLQKIAYVVHCHLKVEFVPENGRSAYAYA